MTSQDPSRRQKINAVFNLAAGALFLVAAFNLLGGGGSVEWVWVVAAAVFLAGGAWGLLR